MEITGLCTKKPKNPRSSRVFLRNSGNSSILNTFSMHQVKISGFLPVTVPESHRSPSRSPTSAAVAKQTPGTSRSRPRTWRTTERVESQGDPRDPSHVSFRAVLEGFLESDFCGYLWVIFGVGIGWYRYKYPIN